MEQFVVNILTWNLQKKSSEVLKHTLKHVAHENEINVIVLQEAGIDVIAELKPDFKEVIYEKVAEKCTLRILIKKDIFDVSQPYKGEQNKLFFVHLKQKGSKEGFNIAGVHLHSKSGSAENKDIVRTHKNTVITDKIKNLESDTKFTSTKRTVLVGDFNANPYDNDLLDFAMIPAIQDRELITILTSESSIFPDTVKNVDYWYNPMWNFFGDHNAYSEKDSKRKAGSYFLFSESWTKMWHLFDGFILRPSIMHCIDYAKSGILECTKSRNFIKPNKLKNRYGLIDELLSDHLPVKISLILN